MSLRSKILGTVCVVAVAAVSGPALADFGSAFSGTLQGQYSNISAGSGGGSANVWGGEGSGAFDLGWSGLKVQVDGGYQGVSFSGSGSVDDWNVDGAFYWQGHQGRIGGTVGYNGFSGSGAGTFNVTNYGGFAEWYAAPMFTVGVKGGGASASDGGFGSGTATYVGGEAVFYAFPNLALNGNVDYFSAGNAGGNITSYGGTAEWLFSESVPVSVYGGYTYSDFSGGGGHLSTWTVGLKFYLNGNGASTLADRQRTGNANWGTETNLINTVF
jgi:hypothetical protein